MHPDYLILLFSPAYCYFKLTEVLFGYNIVYRG